MSIAAKFLVDRYTLFCARALRHRLPIGPNSKARFNYDMPRRVEKHMVGALRCMSFHRSHFSYRRRQGSSATPRQQAAREWEARQRRRLSLLLRPASTPPLPLFDVCFMSIFRRALIIIALAPRRRRRYWTSRKTISNGAHKLLLSTRQGGALLSYRILTDDGIQVL